MTDLSLLDNVLAASQYEVTKKYGKIMQFGKLTIATLLTGTALLSGCATIMSGSTQKINLRAMNYDSHQLIPNAKCTIRDGKGNLYVFPSNPGNVIVGKGNGALQIHCDAKGYYQKSVGHGQGFNGWTIANVIFWPGAIIDAADGAYARYPSHITVLMQKTHGPKKRKN